MENYEDVYTPFLSKREARGLNAKKLEGPDLRIEKRIKQDSENQAFLKFSRRETANLIQNFETELRSQLDKKQKNKKIDMTNLIQRIFQGLAGWHQSFMKYLRRHEPQFTNIQKALDFNISDARLADSSLA